MGEVKTKTELCIIQVAGGGRPKLVWLDLANSLRFYKWPFSSLGIAKYTVLHTKPPIENDNDYLNYYAVNYVLPTLRHSRDKSTGWLTPEGMYYTCDYDELHVLASSLCILLLKVHGNMHTLLDRGWAYIKYTGEYTQTTQPTEYQKNTIKELILSNAHTYFSLKLWKQTNTFI